MAAMSAGVTRQHPPINRAPAATNSGTASTRENSPSAPVQHRPAAGGNQLALPLQQFGQDCFLAFEETGFAHVLEERGDGGAAAGAPAPVAT